MKAYIFPGQGAQFCGMGHDLYQHSEKAKQLFHQANDILGFDISKIMFEGTAEELKETKVTQPAIFIHSVILSYLLEDTFKPKMVAGHSLGEFSALVTAKALSFVEGLQLVSQRALAMQEACDQTKGTMAAILGLENEVVERICKEVNGIVVPANYNCTGQLVISGEVNAVAEACEKMKEAKARRALPLPVGGAFHSPLMETAKEKLEKAIAQAEIKTPICPIYQNVSALPFTEPKDIKQNLIEQLASPVKWTQTVEQMITDGASEFIEVGPGKVLQGLVKKVDRKMEVSSAELG